VFASIAHPLTTTPRTYHDGPEASSPALTIFSPSSITKAMNEAQYLMGIDLGTQSLKVIITDLRGNIRAEEAQSYRFDSPRPGWAEQDPEDWWAAARDCIGRALAKLAAGGGAAGMVTAAGFSGQMHGAVLLDDAGRALRPAILHCDARSGEQAARINAILERRGLRTKLLNPVYTGFLLWVRDHEPEVYQRVRHPPKDYLQMRLSDTICSDFSDASATLAYNIEEFRWFREVLDALEIPEEIFPDCYPSCAEAWRVSAGAAAETGLVEGMVLAAGGGPGDAGHRERGDPARPGHSEHREQRAVLFSERPARLHPAALHQHLLRLPKRGLVHHGRGHDLRTIPQVAVQHPVPRG